MKQGHFPLKKSSPHKVQSHYNTDALNALNHIPAELTRDEWVKIATAFKAAGGSFSEFDAWSSQAESYKPTDCQAVWRSISLSGGIGAGTLFFEAKKYGYKSTSQSAVDFTPLLESAKQNQKAEQEARERDYALVRENAEAQLNECGLADLDYPYLVKKRIKPPLMPWINRHNQLVIPVMDIKGVVHSLQFIDVDGKKLFLKGGAIKGHFYQIWSRSDPSKAIVICEGYATGVTLATHYTPDCSVVVAFNAGNIKPVAQVFRKAFPGAPIIIAGDNDKSGTGQKVAKEAASLVGGFCAFPDFQSDENGSDWNDRYCLDKKADAL